MLIPSEYICPLSKQIMDDPVVCEDGYYYDRSSILKDEIILSPFTNEILNKKNLISNKLLKEAIIKYKINEELSKNISQTQHARDKQIEIWEKIVKEKDDKIINKLNNERETNLKLEKILIEKEKKLNEKINNYYKIFNEKWKTYILSEYDLTIPIKYLLLCDYKQIYSHYKKIFNEYIWIKKYIYGINGSHPLVDHIFDHIKNNESTITEFDNIDKPREYYYMNYELFYNQYSKSKFMDDLNIKRRQMLFNFINIQTFFFGECDPLLIYKQNIDNQQKKNSEYYRDCNSRDFNEIIKIGKLFIDLIEIISPQVVVQFQNENL
jgi:hypothetical protein